MNTDCMYKDKSSTMQINVVAPTKALLKFRKIMKNPYNII